MVSILLRREFCTRLLGYPVAEHRRFPLELSRLVIRSDPVEDIPMAFGAVVVGLVEER